MSLKKYGVLTGRVLDTRAEGGTDSPHFQILVHGDVDYRVAVNVLSQQAPSELLYVADEAFDHPLLHGLADRPDGLSRLASVPGSGALDYIRGNLCDREELRPLPATAPGPDNDLADKLHHYVDRAQADPASRLHAFGQRWGPENGTRDEIFGFLPGNGVHDIHMNQGNTRAFRHDDGVWQDGGLLLHYPGARQWVAIFLAFQSQSWHTDDHTGHARPEAAAGPLPGPGEPDHVVRIVAAQVAGGRELGSATVTLLNSGPRALDLAGWTLMDAQKQQMMLPSTRLPAGETTRIQVQPPVRLNGQGGLLTLLDPAGLKVDGVAYTARQSEAADRTIVF
jgi:uncharacterized protein YukJ